MKDIFKQELNIGDIVAFNEPNYRGLILGKVFNFTPKQVRISYINHNNMECSYLTLPENLVKKLNG